MGAGWSIVKSPGQTRGLLAPGGNASSGEATAFYELAMMARCGEADRGRCVPAGGQIGELGQKQGRTGRCQQADGRQIRQLGRTGS